MPKAHRTLVRRMPWFFLPPQGSNSIDEVDGIMQKLNEENEEHKPRGRCKQIEKNRYIDAGNDKYRRNKQFKR